MLKVSIGCALWISGLAVPINPVNAGEGGLCGPYAASAAFPYANPPGWYTNTYSYAWYYPWFAYYNSSHGPYANWAAGRGYASYGYNKQMPQPYTVLVTVQLPADAKLSFSGIVAEGSGEIRTFPTPPLESNREYSYEMTAEVVKDGRTLKTTKSVVFHAGENVSVKFDLADLRESTNVLQK